MNAHRMLNKVASGVYSGLVPSRVGRAGPRSTRYTRQASTNRLADLLELPVKVGVLMACFCTLVILPGCSLEPESLRVKKSANLRGKRIKTIAILPVESAPSRGTGSGEVTAGGKQSTSEVDSGALLTDMLYSEMRRVPRWTVIPQPKIQAAAGNIKQVDGPKAREIGQRVNADAVLFGRVSRYRERSGRGWGSDQPASIAFNLFLLDTATGKSVWSARFDETQQALSENLLNVGKFVKRKTRFVRADELAREGVTNAVADLAKALGAG